MSDVGGASLEAEDCVTNTSKFWVNMLLVNANKTLFQRLQPFNADWLLLDISEMQYSLMQVKNKLSGKSTYITNSDVLRDSLPLIHERGKWQDCEFIPVSMLSMSKEELLHAVREYVARIKPMQLEERIILVEVFLATEYLSENKLCSFPNLEYSRKINDLLSVYFAEMERLLPNSYVIRMPSNLYCDPKHKWGLGPRHYDKKYYEYEMKALNVIIDPEITEKQAKLDFLHSTYSKYFANQRRNYQKTYQSNSTSSI